MKQELLKDRVALVTGAGRGMGRAAALALAKSGASVVVNDLAQGDVEQVVDEIRACGGDAIGHVANVSIEAEVQRMIQATTERYGSLHILVNNAGILRRTRPAETIPLEEWELVMAVNVRGVFLCTKYALPIMKGQRYGKIVNISSSAGRSTSTFGGAHYTTSKAAVLGLTRHTAREAAQHGININAVAPGNMDTEMVRELASQEDIDRALAGTPMGRMGTPEEEADLVVFLASDDASYITGATVDINGGELMI
jgi:NAD(P)-dependent dehydrogenase (short-subunit alcohol dehydrogenase family)